MKLSDYILQRLENVEALPEPERQNAEVMRTILKLHQYGGINERWISIDTDNLVQVSSSGRMRTRFIVGKGYRNGVPIQDGWRMVDQRISPNLGYPMTSVIGIPEHSVHRLIAATFISKPSDYKTEVNHINGIKYDNRIENLEWVTRRQNCVHKRQILGWRGERCTFAKITEQDVISARMLRLEGMTYRELGEKYGISARSIYEAVVGQTWKHIPNAAPVGKSRRTAANPIPTHEGNINEW